MLDWQLEILATDVNKRALTSARAACYGKRALRATDESYRQRYFTPEEERYRLNPTIRDRVRFRYLNLKTGPFPEAGEEPFDLIFCRNVLIYFQPDTTRQVVAGLARALRPDGYLFLGHAETLLNVHHDFARVQHGGGFFYRLSPHSPTASPPKVPVPPAPRPVPPPAITRPPELPPPTPKKPPAAEPVDLAEIYVAAKQAFEDENFKTASQNYAILLRHNPDHVGALVGYGFLLANRGDYQEALEYCERALAVDDLYPEAYFLRGLIREMESSPEEAVAEYRKVLLLDMSQVMPHYYLSRVYRQLGRVRDAERELRNTLRLLERLPEDRPLVYAGGMQPATLASHCLRELAQLEQLRPMEP